VAGIIKRSSVAPQASSALQAIQPTAAAKKQPPRKRETSKPVTENTTNNPGTGTETETFSSIININKNQEEILDFELFIKVENAKLKQCDQNESEDDEMGGGSDSSGDSDESSKNLLVEQTMQRQNFASKLSTQRKPGVKKPAPKR
jgi:Zn-dependent metalloprotease